MLLVHRWSLVENYLSNKTWGIRKFENDLDNIWNDGNTRGNEKWENKRRIRQWDRMLYPSDFSACEISSHSVMICSNVTSSSIYE